MSCELNLCSDSLMKHVFYYYYFTAPNNIKLQDIYREIERTWKDISGFLSGSHVLVGTVGIYLAVIYDDGGNDDDDDDDNGDDDDDDDDGDGDVDSNSDDDIDVSVGGDDNGGGGEGCSGNDDDDDDGGSGVGRVSVSIDDNDINDDASQFTTYTDFVTNSYGEFWDSSREKSLVPVKKKRVLN